MYWLTGRGKRSLSVWHFLCFPFLLLPFIIIVTTPAIMAASTPVFILAAAAIIIVAIPILGAICITINGMIKNNWENRYDSTPLSHAARTGMNNTNNNLVKKGITPMYNYVDMTVGKVHLGEAINKTIGSKATVSEKFLRVCRGRLS